MIVAMVAVLMVQVPAHQIIRMVAVRNRGMAAVRSMAMRFVVLLAFVLGRTVARIAIRNGDPVLVHMIAVQVVQMAVVKIIHVAVMTNRRVSALGTVSVRVLLMDLVLGSHGQSFLKRAKDRRAPAACGFARNRYAGLFRIDSTTSSTFARNSRRVNEPGNVWKSLISLWTLVRSFSRNPATISTGSPCCFVRR